MLTCLSERIIIGKKNKETRKTFASRASICGRRSTENLETTEVAEQSIARQSSKVTRPLADCQTTFSWRFNQNGKMLRKVAERSRDSRRMVTRLSAESQTILCRRISKNGKFKKNCWMVTRQWLEVTRSSTDSQTTLFWRYSKNSKILKKVAVRSRNSRRRSRDRRLAVKQPYFDVTAKTEKFWKSRWTVTRQSSEVTQSSTDCQLFLDVSTKMTKFWKKSLNGHATVVGRSRNRRLTVRHFQCCCYLTGWIQHQHACNSVV